MKNYFKVRTPYADKSYFFFFNNDDAVYAGRALGMARLKESEVRRRHQMKKETPILSVYDASLPMMVNGDIPQILGPRERGSPRGKEEKT